MAALATLTQLKARTTVATADDARATQLLADASAAFRAYTGQRIEAATSTDALLRPRNGFVRLPQRPVNSVSAVKDSNDNALLFTWQGGDKVWVSPNLPDTFAWEPWRQGITHVKVTYTHGFAAIPDDIVAMICQIAAFVLGQDPQDAAITQETLASYSYTRGSAALAGVFAQVPGMREIFELYRAPQIGTMSIAGR